MATYKSFTELDVWKRARDLSIEIFQATSTGTFARDFGLRDQINRATGSIMDNIAEGFERSGKNEFVNFLGYAKGSCGETQSQLYRAFDRRHLTEPEFNNLIGKAENVGRMLNGFIGYLNTSQVKGFKFKDRI